MNYDARLILSGIYMEAYGRPFSPRVRLPVKSLVKIVFVYMSEGPTFLSDISLLTLEILAGRAGNFLRKNTQKSWPS